MLSSGRVAISRTRKGQKRLRKIASDIAGSNHHEINETHYNKKGNGALFNTRCRAGPLQTK